MQEKKADVASLGLVPRKTQIPKGEGCQRFYSVTPDDCFYYCYFLATSLEGERSIWLYKGRRVGVNKVMS